MYFLCVCVLCHIYEDIQLFYSPYGRGTYRASKQLSKHRRFWTVYYSF